MAQHLLKWLLLFLDSLERIKHFTDDLCIKSSVDLYFSATHTFSSTPNFTYLPKFSPSNNPLHGVLVSHFFIFFFIYVFLQTFPQMKILKECVTQSLERVVKILFSLKCRHNILIADDDIFD